MKKSNKAGRTSAISIVFYVVAVIFLCLAAFNIWQAYEYVQAQQAQYTLKFSYIFYVYSTYCAQYFAFAFILYGVGVGLHKIQGLHNAFSVLVQDAEIVEDEAVVEVEEVEPSVTEEAVIEEIK